MKTDVDIPRVNKSIESADLIQVIASLIDITIDSNTGAITHAIAKRSPEYYVRAANARTSEALLLITKAIARRFIEQPDLHNVNENTLTDSRPRESVQQLERNATTLHAKLVQLRHDNFRFDWIDDKTKHKWQKVHNRIDTWTPAT